jgi:cytidine deaminase
MSEIKNISIYWREFQDKNELGAEDQELIRASVEAARSAYAPYSQFRVGAAVRLESGRIVHGANVENAAFPSGICAERTALAASITNYPDDRPVTLAISAISEDGSVAEQVTPCGNCRQVIAEEESRWNRQIRILLAGKNKIIELEGIGQLLPLQFNRKNLRSDRP